MEIQQQEDNKKVTQSSINDVETTAPGVSFRVEEEGIVGEVMESETEEKIEAEKEANEA